MFIGANMFMHFTQMSKETGALMEIAVRTESDPLQTTPNTLNSNPYDHLQGGCLLFYVSNIMHLWKL